MFETEGQTAGLGTKGGKRKEWICSCPDDFSVAPKLGTMAPDMGAKITQRTEPIADALFGAARQAVLRLLYGHVEERFYQRQIVREAAVGYGATQRELRRLTDCGILKRIVEGRQTYYQANPECPVFEELCSLIRKTFGVADVLRAALATLSRQIRVAFIFGSIAKGQEGPQSDVDLMVIGDALRPSEVRAAIRPAEERLRREVNSKVYQTDEFCRKLAAGQHFVSRVVADPKVFLIGDERGLAELAAKRVVETPPDESAGNRRTVRPR